MKGLEGSGGGKSDIKGRKRWNNLVQKNMSCKEYFNERNEARAQSTPRQGPQSDIIEMGQIKIEICGSGKLLAHAEACAMLQVLKQAPDRRLPFFLWGSFLPQSFGEAAVIF